MIDTGRNAIKEKGCQHLCKLESNNRLQVNLMNWFRWANENIKNRVGTWGKRCLEVEVEEVDIDDD